jgi:hypothetical protein
MLSEELRMSKTTCHEILTEDLGKRKLNARLVTLCVNEAQKADCSETKEKVLASEAQTHLPRRKLVLCLRKQI